MKYRNPLKLLVLSIITLGIYDIYWLVKTKTELNAKTKIKIPTIWLLFIPIIIFIIAIAAIVITSHPSTTASNQMMYSSSSSTSTSSNISGYVVLLDIVAFVIFIPVTFYWFFQYSKAVNEYTKGEMNTAVAFLLLWMLHFIGVIIVQDKFNELLAADRISGPVQPTSQVASPPQPFIPPQQNQPTPPIVTPPAPVTTTLPQPPVDQVVPSTQPGNQPETHELPHQ